MEFKSFQVIKSLESLPNYEKLMLHETEVIRSFVFEISFGFYVFLDFHI